MKRLIYGLSAVSLAVFGSAFTNTQLKTTTHYYIPYNTTSADFRVTVPKNQLPSQSQISGCGTSGSTLCSQEATLLTVISQVVNTSTTYGPKSTSIEQTFFKLP